MPKAYLPDFVRIERKNIFFTINLWNIRMKTILLSRINKYSSYENIHCTSSSSSFRRIISVGDEVVRNEKA